MRARVTEGRLGGARWLSVAGGREEAFRALGAAAADDVGGVLAEMPELPSLQRRTATPAGARVLEAVMSATRERHATQLAEVRALAAGAGADPGLAVLANLRGDLGSEDGTGCSDLGWHRRRSYVAHNEDGASAHRDRFMFLSLAVDGEPPVFVAWYPGFVPANSFVITGHGLVWGIDHLTVHRPHPGPGRHFVARSLQGCESLDAAVAYLGEHPSAGGFAYTIGEFGAGRVATVEVAAGRHAVTYADPDDRPLLWHTNHVKYVGDAGIGTSENSEARGCVLDGLQPPADEPDAAWFLDLLAGAPVPRGVHRPYAPDHGGMTLATAVADLTAKEVSVRPAAGRTEVLPFEALLAGP
ncbi:MAG: C45 family autoproteolytic acyltransferase/hydrolase [Streptosporangiales bacterium]